MEVDLNFEPDTDITSLKELSTIAIASQLWQSSDMKKKMEEILDVGYPLWQNHFENSPTEKNKYFYELSLEISKTVSQKLSDLKDLMLPEVIKILIQEKVLEMLEDRFDWIMYLIHELKLNYKLTKEIYWTSKGKINEDEIFRQFWMNHFRDTPTGWNDIYGNLSLIQYLACIFAQEEYIVINQADFVAKIKSYRPLQMENNFDIVFTIMKIVIAHYHNKDFSLSDPVKISSEIVTKPTDEILDMCLELGLYKAFISFWKRLDANDQFQYLEKQSAFTHLKYNPYTNYSFNIALFLMNQMNYTQKYRFVWNNIHNVIYMFSRETPLRKYCIPLLEHFFPPFENSTTGIILILNCAYNYQWSTQPRRNLQLQILELLFARYQPNRLDDVCRDAMRIFFKIFDLPALKLVINHANTAHYKKKLISIGRNKYMDLIQEDNFELLNRFMDEVLMTEEEINKFKQDYNFLEIWIEKTRFDVADKVLVWLYENNYREHKVQLKTLCSKCIPKRYDSIEKLLKWYFDAEDEPLVNGCADKLKLLNEFCVELIYNIWFPVIDSCETDKNIIEIWAISCAEISTKVLLLVFVSEEEIHTFKTNELVNVESFVSFICENAAIRGHRFYGLEPRFPLMDKFFTFCELTSSSIENIKELIYKKIRR